MSSMCSLSISFLDIPSPHPFNDPFTSYASISPFSFFASLFPAFG